LNKVYPLDVTTGYPRGAASLPASAPEGEDVISLQRVIRAVRRRFSLMIAVFLLTFAGVAVFTFQLKPSYTATSRVIVATHTQDIVDVSSFLSGMPANAAVIDTEAEILRGRDLIEKVVRRLDLVNNPEFNWAKAEPSEMDKNVGAVKSFIKSLIPFGKKKAEVVEGPVVNTDEAQRAELDSVISAVRNSIWVNRVGSTFLIDISASSGDPKMAAKLANTMADVYINNQRDQKDKSLRQGQDWLDLRVAELKSEVMEKESRAQAFRDRTGLNTAEGSTLIEQTIRDLNAQLSLANADYQSKSSRLNSLNAQIQSGATIDSMSEALTSPNIIALKSEQAQLSAKKAEIERKYDVGNPAFQQVQNEWADLNRRITAELGKLVASLEQDTNFAREKVRAFENSLAQERGKLTNANASSVEQGALERDAATSRGLLESYNARLKETDNVAEIIKPDAMIDSYAPTPGGPSFPNTTLNLAFGIMLGMALAAFAGLVTELLDNYISSPEEVEQVAGVPYIGQIPLLPAAGNFTKARVKPAEYLIDKPHSGFAEGYRHLRASIMFADIDKAAKTVAVVSSLPSEGKTSMTYCLGRMAAMSGTKTIVIDGDIRLRQLTEISGVNAEAGLLEYLFGEARLAEAVHTDDKTGLHILPLTDRKHTPRDVFGSRAFDALLNMLQQTYDLIIIDTGPILLMAETRVVTSKVDQVVVATRWRKTNRGTLRETMKILRDFHANVAGVVLTFVDLRKRAHHAYTSADYKAYSKYYHES
jgi:capsular exopolysaccharide synthesis family protein